MLGLIGSFIDNDCSKPKLIGSSSYGCCVDASDNIIVNSVDLSLLSCNPTLKYDLFKFNGTDWIEIPILISKTGLLHITYGSAIIVGTGTLFTTELIVGSKIYNGNNEFVGIVSSITNNTHLILDDIAILNYSGISYSSEIYYYSTPDNSSIFNYIVTETGQYKLVASLTSGVNCDTYTWYINICTSYIVNTGTCNNPIISNLSSTTFILFTLKTYNSNDIINTISQQVILKYQILSPNSSFIFPKLIDGFYQLFITIVDNVGTIVSVEPTQVLFYDCNIKSCEVYLSGQVLGFLPCVDCDEKDIEAKRYSNIIINRDKFQILKNIVYSYWNKIKSQQSIPESWDIEDHLQDITTYSDALNQLSKICNTCGFEFGNRNINHSHNSHHFSKHENSENCGCNK